jgi:large subunit ribosomal protein L5e
MAFVKTIKNKAYSKRYQTKFKRRRQGKTDYYARKRLVVQDKNKYDSKKYRLVVRRTCSKIICQIIYSTITGDKVLCAADSKELRRWGLEAGLTNYAASYATGLLVARRLLKQLKMDDMYKGADKCDGEYFSVADNMDDNRRPFKALLDVGLVRTTTGNRVFGALKGASDGGLDVPHKTKRFPGFHVEEQEMVVNKRGKKEKAEEGPTTSYDAKEHRDHIVGNHVQKYMDEMKSEDPEKFKTHFSRWSACLTKAKAKSIEELMTRVHAEIRKNPDRVVNKRKHEPVRKVVQKGAKLVQQNSKGKKWLREHRFSHEERKQRVIARITAAMQ